MQENDTVTWLALGSTSYISTDLPRASTSVAPLIVDHPRDDIGHGRKHACRAQEGPKYLTATDVHVASSTYPIPPTQLRPVIIRPRCRVRSAIQHANIVTTADIKCGGAVSP